MNQLPENYETFYLYSQNKVSKCQIKKSNYRWFDGTPEMCMITEDGQHLYLPLKCFEGWSTTPREAISKAMEIETEAINKHIDNYISLFKELEKQ